MHTKSQGQRWPKYVTSPALDFLMDPGFPVFGTGHVQELFEILWVVAVVPQGSQGVPRGPKGSRGPKRSGSRDGTGLQLWFHNGRCQ